MNPQRTLSLHTRTYETDVSINEFVEPLRFFFQGLYLLRLQITFVFTHVKIVDQFLDPCHRGKVSPRRGCVGREALCGQEDRLGEGLETSVSPESTVIVLPAMAGGAR